MSLLDDAWRRVDWADGDGETLKETIDEFTGTNPYTIEVQFDGEGGTATFRRLIDPATEREWFALIARVFGSFLDKARAALNYAAYQLALQAIGKYPTISLKPESVEFPIFNTKSSFENKYWVKAFPDEYRSILDQVQPREGRYPGLWLLHELARKHRHRLIHPVRAASFSDYHGVFIDGVSIADVEVVHDGPLEADEVVLRFPFVGDSGSDVYPAVAIAMGVDDPICSGRHMVEIANMISEDASSALNAIAVAFFGYSPS
jgi:hypothetical protein